MSNALSPILQKHYNQIWICTCVHHYLSSFVLRKTLHDKVERGVYDISSAFLFGIRLLMYAFSFLLLAYY
jgi:hypothetical protein